MSISVKTHALKAPVAGQGDFAIAHCGCTGARDHRENWFLTINGTLWEAPSPGQEPTCVVCRYKLGLAQWKNGRPRKLRFSSPHAMPEASL